MNWTNLKVWIHGLAAAAVSGAASAVSGCVALPTVFTFDKNGVANMIKLAVPPAIIAVALYLKKSPVPALTATVDDQGNVQVEGNPVVEVQVKGKN